MKAYGFFSKYFASSSTNSVFIASHDILDTRAKRFTEIFKWVISFYYSHYFIIDFQVAFKLNSSFTVLFNTKWDKVFKNGPRKTCGRKPFKNLKGYGLPKVDHTLSNFLKAVFNKFYLVHFWILFPKCQTLINSNIELCPMAPFWKNV